jgi:hypothetical protein
MPPLRQINVALLLIEHQLLAPIPTNLLLSFIEGVGTSTTLLQFPVSSDYIIILF